MRTHTGERPYGCEQCGMSFVTSSAKKNGTSASTTTNIRSSASNVDDNSVARTRWQNISECDTAIARLRRIKKPDYRVPGLVSQSAQPQPQPGQSTNQQTVVKEPKVEKDDLMQHSEEHIQSCMMPGLGPTPNLITPGLIPPGVMWLPLFQQTSQIFQFAVLHDYRIFFCIFFFFFFFFFFRYFFFFWREISPKPSWSFHPVLYDYRSFYLFVYFFIFWGWEIRWILHDWSDGNDGWSEQMSHVLCISVFTVKNFPNEVSKGTMFLWEIMLNVWIFEYWILWTWDAFENDYGIEHKLEKYWKETFWLVSNNISLSNDFWILFFFKRYHHKSWDATGIVG